MVDENILNTFAQFFNDNTKDNYSKFKYHVLNEQLKNVALNQKTILDIGCGKGMVSSFICMYYDGCEVIAIDEDKGEGLDAGSLKTIYEAKSKFDLKNLTILILIQVGSYVLANPIYRVMIRLLKTIILNLEN